MSLGKDLAFIRKKQNLSLEDIQNEIKIPLLTLKSIEDGSIFIDSGETKTYIRSFVRSYAKILGIDDADIVQALNEVEAGTYSGSLLADTKKPDELDHKTESTEPNDSETIDREKQAEPKPTNAKKEPKASPVTDVHSVNWADMGKKFSSVRQHSNLWVIVSFFVVLVIAILTTIFYWDSLSTVFSSNQTDEPQVMSSQPSTTEDESQIPTADDLPSATQNSDSTDLVPEPVNNTPMVMGDTLTVTVYAAFDKLEPVRVTSDFNWKTNPFWMEQGDAFNFEFRDSLLVDGQYSRMLLLFNGHIIENPRQSYFDETFNAILITRSLLDQPEYLEPAPAVFPLEVGPPDSTEYVIRF